MHLADRDAEEPCQVGDRVALTVALTEKLLHQNPVCLGEMLRKYEHLIDL
jgi:hypothetical protein